MNPIRITILAVFMLLGSIAVSAADDLGMELRKSGWDRIIGIWGDPETNGAKCKVTYRWRYKDKVIEIVSVEGGRETTALVARNPRTGEVFHVAADNQGGSCIGKWTLSKEGDAVLGILFIDGAGQEGGLEMRHRLQDDNTMLVTVSLPDPITFKLVRVTME